MKYIIGLLFLVLSVQSFAQKGVVQTIAPDTLTAVETEYFVAGPFGTAWDNLTIQAVHTQLGGAADGTGVLQASVDGVSFVTIQDYSGIMKSFPNDSVDIANGLINEWVIKDVPFNYFRYAATGTDSDTTLVTVKYIYK